MTQSVEVNPVETRLFHRLREQRAEPPRVPPRAVGSPTHQDLVDRFATQRKLNPLLVAWEKHALETA